jgi:hypothetical protein
LIRSLLPCSCLILCSVLLCYILFCSILFCFVTSCLVLHHVVLTRIALFLRFTVPYFMPFYAMRHCDVTLCYTAQCTLHSFLRLLISEALPYCSVLVYPLKYNNIHQIYDVIVDLHGACVTLQLSTVSLERHYYVHFLFTSVTSK